MTKDDVLRIWGEQAKNSVGLPHDEFVFMFASAVSELEREACAAIGDGSADDAVREYAEKIRERSNVVSTPT